MARIKTVKVNAISSTARGYYWNYKTFVTFTDDKGNETYFVNGKEVSKDEGNAIYVEMRDSNKYWVNSKAGADYFKRQRVFKKAEDTLYVWDGYTYQLRTGNVA